MHMNSAATEITIKIKLQFWTDILKTKIRCYNFSLLNMYFNLKKFLFKTSDFGVPILLKLARGGA